MNTLRLPTQKNYAARFREYMKSQWPFLVMVFPYAFLLFMFIYLPMGGLVLAFKNFHIDQGIWGSPWAGWQNFEFFFNSEYAWRATRNTILLNLLFITANHLFAIFCAVTLYEIRSKWFRKGIQSITFFPSFLSWVVIAVLSLGIFETDRGSINQFLTMLHLQKVNWYSWPEIWPALLTFIYLWKNAGTLIVIYVASLTSINPEYYEAAKIDGADFWQRVRHVTLPLARPGIATAVLLTAVPMLGELVIPSLLGGDRGVLVGQAISSQYLDAQNYALGSAMAVIVLVIVALMVAALARFTRGFDEVPA